MAIHSPPRGIDGPAEARGPTGAGVTCHPAAARFQNGAASGYGVAMRLLAPAKINLYLRVGKRRDDGFHPLSTWMCTVGLFDILALEAIAQPASETPGAPARGASLPTTGRAGEPAGVPLDLRFDCDQPGLPRDEGNLVVRIAEAFAAEVFAPSLAGGGRASPSADGGTGETARGGGGEDGSGYAGVARVKAPGIGDAGRSRSVGPVTDGTERGAGATRDAERPVGEK